jgi:acyl carrier protein
MNETELTRKLREVVGRASRSEVTDISLEEDLVAVLGLDSLAGLRVLAAVEKHFEVRFPDDRLTEFRTLSQIYEVIRNQRKEPSS